MIKVNFNKSVFDLRAIFAHKMKPANSEYIIFTDCMLLLSFYRVDFTLTESEDGQSLLLDIPVWK